jgi:membrane dipeptidase
MKTQTLRAAIALTLAVSCAGAAAAAPEAAIAFARDTVILDTHIDAPTELLKHWKDLGMDAPGAEFDHPKAQAGGLDVAFMSIYTSPAQDADDSAWAVANQMIDAVEALVQRHPDKFSLMRSPRDITAIAGRVLLPLGMENGAPIGDDLSQLKFFFDRGVRYITLAHSANNAISDSSYARSPTWGGLSPFGEQVVAEMNRLGIMVDVSHLSDAAALRAIALSRVPVIASHSSFRHFTPGFERNISDELAKQVAAKGGVVHVTFGNGFVNPKSAADTQAYFDAKAKLDASNAAATADGKPVQTAADFDAAWDASHPRHPTAIDAVLDHIDHGVKLLGIDHVGIGSDFDGVSGDLPDGLRTAADYPNLVEALRARGYSDADLAKLLGGNLLRAWRAVEDGANR